MKKELNVLKLGKCDYEKALEIQYSILEKRQCNEIPDTLILVEHPPVITLGRHALTDNIIVSEEFLKKQGITTYHTDRGGDVTYHGYGQVVGYPIVNLREKSIGIRALVERLEQLFIKLLKNEFDIHSGKKPNNTGVWVDNNKITAIGLAVKKGVTMHGFAFNVNTSMEHFKFIVPCGISDKGVTSVEQSLKGPVDLETVNELVLKYFIEIFEYEGYKLSSE